MIKRSGANKIPSAVNTAESETLNVSRGIRVDTAPDDLASVIDCQNFELGTDGFFVLRKPVIRLANNDSGNMLTLADLTHFVNISKDTGGKYTFTIGTDTSADTSTVHIRYTDTDYTEHDTSTASDIADTFDFANAKRVYTGDTTLITGVSVNLRSAFFERPIADLEEYDASKTEEWRLRYLSVYDDVDKHDTQTQNYWVMEIINPEINTIASSEEGDALNPNLTLDNPYALRDLYDYGYPSVTNIVMYGDTKANATSLADYKNEYLDESFSIPDAEVLLSVSVSYSNGKLHYVISAKESFCLVDPKLLFPEGDACVAVVDGLDNMVDPTDYMQVKVTFAAGSKNVSTTFKVPTYVPKGYVFAENDSVAFETVPNLLSCAFSIEKELPNANLAKVYMFCDSETPADFERSHITVLSLKVFESKWGWELPSNGVYIRPYEKYGLRTYVDSSKKRYLRADKSISFGGRYVFASKTQDVVSEPTALSDGKTYSEDDDVLEFDGSDSIYLRSWNRQRSTNPLQSFKVKDIAENVSNPDNARFEMVSRLGNDLPELLILKAVITSPNIWNGYYCVWERSLDNGITWGTVPEFESIWYDDLKAIPVSDSTSSNETLESADVYTRRVNCVKFNPTSQNDNVGDRPDILPIPTAHAKYTYRFRIFQYKGSGYEVPEDIMYPAYHESMSSAYSGAALARFEESYCTSMVLSKSRTVNIYWHHSTTPITDICYAVAYNSDMLSDSECETVIEDVAKTPSGSIQINLKDILSDVVSKEFTGSVTVRFVAKDANGIVKGMSFNLLVQILLQSRNCESVGIASNIRSTVAEPLINITSDKASATLAYIGHSNESGTNVSLAEDLDTLHTLIDDNTKNLQTLDFSDISYDGTGLCGNSDSIIGTFQLFSRPIVGNSYPTNMPDVPMLTTASATNIVSILGNIIGNTMVSSYSTNFCATTVSKSSSDGIEKCMLNHNAWGSDAFKDMLAPVNYVVFDKLAGFMPFFSGFAGAVFLPIGVGNVADIATTKSTSDAAWVLRTIYGTAIWLSRLVIEACSETNITIRNNNAFPIAIRLNMADPICSKDINRAQYCTYDNSEGCYVPKDNGLVEHPYTFETDTLKGSAECNGATIDFVIVSGKLSNAPIINVPANSSVSVTILFNVLGHFDNPGKVFGQIPSENIADLNNYQMPILATSIDFYAGRMLPHILVQSMGSKMCVGRNPENKLYWTDATVAQSESTPVKDYYALTDDSATLTPSSTEYYYPTKVFWDGNLSKTSMLNVPFSTENDSASTTIANAVELSFVSNVITKTDGKTEYVTGDAYGIVSGTTVYHEGKLLTYNVEKYPQLLFISESDSYITPMLNSVNLQYGSNVTAVVPWRKYVLVFTANATYIVSDSDSGDVSVKTLSTQVGVPKNDGKAAVAILNSIIFKSGGKVYRYVPNQYSTTDSILNIACISKPIDGLLDADAECFAFTDEEYYRLFECYDEYTVGFTYNYLTGTWTKQRYEHPFKDYSRLGLSSFALTDGKGTYSFDRLLSEIKCGDLEPLSEDTVERLTYGDIYGIPFKDIHAKLVPSDGSGEPDYDSIEKNITPMQYGVDFGEKSARFTVSKQFLELKMNFSTLDPKDTFPFDLEVYSDGMPHELRISIDPNTDAALLKPNQGYLGSLSTQFDMHESCISNTMRQLFVKYSGRGKTVRFRMEGESKTRFKLCTLDSRYRVLPNKQ